jgi:hypothetical protein
VPAGTPPRSDFARDGHFEHLECPRGVLEEDFERGPRVIQQHVTDDEMLSGFLDAYLGGDSIITRVAEGQPMSEEKYESAIKRTVRVFAGSGERSSELYELVKEEYARRRAANENRGSTA